ncbi:MAG: hypothetical protein ABFS08_07620 [Pseudomonadota bacterium]
MSWLDCIQLERNFIVDILNLLIMNENIAVLVLGFSLAWDYTPLVGNWDIGNLYLNKDVSRDDLRISGQREVALHTWSGAARRL